MSFIFHKISTLQWQHNDPVNIYCKNLFSPSFLFEGKYEQKTGSITYLLHKIVCCIQSKKHICHTKYHEARIWRIYLSYTFDWSNMKNQLRWHEDNVKWWVLKQSLLKQLTTYKNNRGYSEIEENGHPWKKENRSKSWRNIYFANSKQSIQNLKYICTSKHVSLTLKSCPFSFCLFCILILKHRVKITGELGAWD